MTSDATGFAGTPRSAKPSASVAVLLLGLVVFFSPASASERTPIRGLTGTVSEVAVAIPAAERIALSTAAQPPADIDLKRMAHWAMHYLAETPRPELGYEPVFQCNPLRCPPIPAGHDPVVPCDTDARMDWEWYYMREISGSTEARAVEAAFHRRIRSYIDADGVVWASPGALNESQTEATYDRKDFIIHIWGATKILKSLAEDYARTGDPAMKAEARKVMVALKKLAIWDDRGRCWFACGMGGLRADRTVVPNPWNAQPAPIVESLVTYGLATKDAEGLEFARAYAEGMINNLQPDGIRFLGGDRGVTGGGRYGPHVHATMHAVWGVGHLGLATGEQRYVDFAKGVWDWMLTRSTGTGWFPEGPDFRDETCAISDMMSVAAVVARGGHPEYYDAVERCMRNYISPLQFIMTPEFEAAYRERNRASGAAAVEQGLRDLGKFQGGIIGGSGLNDVENTLLGGRGGYSLRGCCAPEGMRAIYTTWSNTIERREASEHAAAGVYVNLSFTRESPWGQVVSYFPEAGRLTVRAALADSYFLRPPHWAPRDQVRAFVGTKPVPIGWSGDYVRFDGVTAGEEVTITYPLLRFTHDVGGLWKNTAPDLRMTFHWLGNMVVDASPAGGPTPLFTGRPRQLPEPPALP